MRAAIEELAAAVREELLGPSVKERRKVVLGAFVIALLIGAHLARAGTTRYRVAAAVVVAIAAITPVVFAVLRARRLRDDHGVIRAAGPVLGAADVSRALSAASLAVRVARSKDHEGVSPSLARMHAERALARIEVRRLAPAGERHARSLRWVALALLVAATGIVAIAPARVVEGVDVAFARHGVAPLEIAWLDDVTLTVHAPAYLHKEDQSTSRYGQVVAERGAAIRVRGIPRRHGRTLLLADDVHEVPFLDDGAGGVVAHWSVAASGKLRVRARFGNVVVEEPTSWDLVVVDDASPQVTLEGAPGTIELEKAGPTVPLRYDAWDDHGLREVHLVIRIGVKEERRVLAKLDGEPRHDRGGYVLRMSDPLIQKARVPIAIRVEARDNDPVTGPKWGKSAEIVLVPPVIGAGEVARYEAIRARRDELVDLLAAMIEGAPKIDRLSVDALSAKWDAASRSLDALLLESWGSVRIPPRLALILRGRMRKIREAFEAEKKAPSAVTHDATTKLLERLVLGADAALHSLGTRDAKGIAKLLADIATDGADAMHEVAGMGEAARTRLDVDLKALDGGGGSMRRLGELGRDLGEIVENDLRRVDRAYEAATPDYYHAELALRDLAARMRDPKPSFGGGTPPSTPGQGGGDGEGGEGDESEDEAEAANEESQIEELAKEQGATIGEVEDVLRDAEDPADLDGLKEEAARRAEELRKAVAGLPKNGGLKKTLDASEASLREKAEAMAQALEQLQMGDARERGDSAMKAGDEALDKAWIQPGAEEQIADVQQQIQKQNDWIDDLLRELRKKAQEKASGKVKSIGPHQQGLEQKAKEIGEQSEKKQPLPEQVKDLLEKAQEKMGEAAKKLDEGEADDALKAQRDAQRLLERARDMAKGEEEPGGPTDGGQKMNPDDAIDIPKADDFKGPEAFRKRVLEGLGSGASQKLQDAVKRYAEGLIQ